MFFIINEKNKNLFWNNENGESMDLEMDELFGIIDRAMNRFEQAKEKI